MSVVIMCWGCKWPYFFSNPIKILSLLSSPPLPTSGSVAGAPVSSVYVGVAVPSIKHGPRAWG